MSRFWEKIKKRPVLSLFLLALGIRLFALAVNPESWQTAPDKDSWIYNNLAVQIVSGNGLTLEGRPTAKVPPLYPLFLAGVYHVFSFSRFAALVLQVIFGSLLVFFIYRLGEEVFSRRVASIAAAAAVVYWPFIAVGMKLLSEVLFIPLMVAGGYYTIVAYKYRRPGLAAVAVVITGLAILTRPIILYFSAIVILWFIWDYFRNRNKRALFSAGLYLCVLLLIHLPWVVRNYSLFGHFIPTNTLGGQALYSGNLPKQDKLFGFNPRLDELDPSERYIFDLPEVEQDKALTRMAIDGLKKQPPAKVAKLFLLKFLFFWIPFDWEVLGNPKGIFNTWFFWVGIFFLYWLRHLRWREDYFFPCAIIVYFMLICLVTYGSPRLRLPVEPFLLLFAAAGWQTLESRSAGRLKNLIGIFILLSLIGGYHFGEEIKEAGRVIAVWLGIW